MSNDYQVSQETDAMKRLSKSRTGLFSKEDNDKECSECGGEPYPTRQTTIPLAQILLI